ncbi:La-related protein 1C [Ananas comosus]|uniref:La-related protein 1C n=1 Tax=Ananas comosus TaxID=4615 RepID=A0A199VRU9_ANACO|nr:La-related protein 1C [Ananas comosus]
MAVVGRSVAATAVARGFNGYGRGLNGRDFHAQQHRGAPPYIRPPPPIFVPPPFFGHPPQVRPFEASMPFPPEMPSLVYYVATPPPPPPFLASPATPPAMFFPTIDPKQAKLLRQIDYYFSTENLCKDTYLRENMDDQGWVPLSLIANFNRVRQLTDDIQFVMETVQLSSAVELQGDKIRRRYDWRNWLLPQPNNLSGTDLGLSSASTSSVDNTVVRLQAAELEGETNHTIGI